MSTAARQKIGIVASAGGSSILALLPLLHARNLELVVATDRACGIEQACSEQGITCQRFAYTDRDAFSQAVGDYFLAQGVTTLVLLLYSRFVGTPLYERLPTWNIHPALLPAFPGLHPLKQQLNHGAPLIGATLHVVDASCDGGPILGQVATTHAGTDVERLSFLQKTYLALAAVERAFPSGETMQRYLNASLPLGAHAHAFFRGLEDTYQRRILA